MALEAQGPHISQIALASAFGDGHYVVGVPEGFSTAFPQSPVFQKPPPGRVIELAQIAPQRQCVGPAGGTNSLVAFQHLLSQIARIGAQLPFVNAGRRAEGAASFGRFGAAPAA